MFFSNVRLAFRAFGRAPWRTFLVLQGIAWGVGIAIFPAAILQGSRETAERRAAEVGTGRVSLLAEPGTRPFTADDAAVLEKGIPGYLPFGVAPFRVDGGRAAEGPGSGRVAFDLVGTSAAGATVRDQKVGSGRYLEPAEVAADRRVAVLEPRVARDLFGERDPVGESVRVTVPGAVDLELAVVGVLAPRSDLALRVDDFGMEIDHPLHRLAWRMLESIGASKPDDGWKRSERAIHVPLGLLPREGDAVDTLIARTRPSEAPQLADALRGALVERGASPVAYSNLVWPVIASDRIEHYMRLKDALVLACLAMGGIVIANVMLLTLLQRTGEIAVRRAEGATRRDIAVQFLVEAGVLGVVGAALGIPLGMGLAHGRIALDPHASLGVAFPGEEALTAILVAVLVAVLAGVLPARRAAALEPVEALRAP